MASIERRVIKPMRLLGKYRKRTRFRVKIRLKGHPVQTATFNQLKDAKKWAQQTEAAICEGRYFKTTEAKRHTLSEAIDRYIKHVLPTKPKSECDQRTQLNWFKAAIGEHVLADVTPPLIAEQRDKLAKGEARGKRTAATVNRYLAALSHMFTIAVKEWGWVGENPLSKVTKLKEPRGRVRYLLEDEREALLKSCLESDNTVLYTVMVLALSTGARKMEILGLCWDDVDINRRVITLHHTKNNERRVLPLEGHALELMEQHSKIRRIDTDLVFPSRKGIKPMDIRHSWATALKIARIEDFRFHDLRHSAASYLAMNGASLAEIAEVLGHKTLLMVKRYAHLSDAHTAKVVASMNDKIFGT